MQAGVFGHDDLLQALAHPVFIPFEQAHELLQSAWRDLGRVGDRFQAFLGQVRKLPPDADAQMGPRILARKTVSEASQEAVQFRRQLTKPVGIHAASSRKPSGHDSFADLGVASKAKLAL